MNGVERLAQYAKSVIIEKTKYSKVIGVGTGRTVSMVLQELPDAFFKEKLFAASSFDTAIKLASRGARVVDVSLLNSVDFYFDSADWFDIGCNLLKGGGGALLREKILMSLSEETLVLVNSEKFVRSVLEKPIPIEISPPAFSYVRMSLKKKGIKLEYREGGRRKWGPLVSDNSNLLADAFLPDALKSSSAEQIDLFLSSIPGVVVTGIFPRGFTTQLVISDYNKSLKDQINCDGEKVLII